MAQSLLEVSNSALIKVGSKTIASLSDDVLGAQLCNARADIIKRKLLRRHPWNFAIIRKVIEPTWATINNAADNGSGLIRITTSAVHGRSTGDRVTIHEVEGTVEANGTWTITVIDTTNFDLQLSTFSNTYTTGGEWTLAAIFEYAYSIALPSDNLRVLRVNDCDFSPDWRIEKGRLLTNDEINYLKYIYDVTDYTTMPTDFYECHALALAIDICIPLTGSDQRKAELKTEYRELMASVRFTDATEDPAEVLEADDWLLSRFGSPFLTRDRSYYGRY